MIMMIVFYTVTFVVIFLFGFTDFQEAVEHKKTTGWKSVRVDEEWKDKCPDCVSKEEPFWKLS